MSTEDIVKPDKPQVIVMENMCRHKRALPVVDEHEKSKD
jgi:hypothetical protein